MRTITMLAAAALMTGCAHDGAGMSANDTVPPALAGTRWSIASINGSAPSSQRKTEVQFSEDRISGNAGCNSFGGAYTIANETLTATQIISTKMACPGPGMDQENAVFKILGQPMTVTWQGDGSLMLSDAAGTMTLTPEG